MAKRDYGSREAMLVDKSNLFIRDEISTIQISNFTPIAPTQDNKLLGGIKLVTTYGNNYYGINKLIFNIGRKTELI